MPKRVIILGSTGSIGCSALDVAQHLGDECEVVGLAARSNWQPLQQQIQRFKPQVAVLSDQSAADQLSNQPGNNGAAVWAGEDAMVRMVQELDADFVLASIVGVAGLASTLAAVERGLTVGLANKESLVVAGSLMVDAARRSGAKLIPIDSEHSAIYQSLQSGRHEEIERLLLTGSGGPFRTWTTAEIAEATLEDALKHPTWNMGPKITVDSATLMNKALEIIEAKWLFDVPPDRIEVVIHPESIIHSMVAFCDGSIIAQMGQPDMRTPIQYALTHPHRYFRGGERLDFSALGKMHFEPPDEKRFPALRLGHQVAARGGTAGAAFNAANEAANEQFRAGKIRFARIAELVEDVLNRHAFTAHPDLKTLTAVDAWARQEVLQCSK